MKCPGGPRPACQGWVGLDEMVLSCCVEIQGYQAVDPTRDEFIDAKRLYFPGMARVYRGLAPYAYAIMRFSTGAVLVPHGVQKILMGSLPGLSANIDKAGLPMPLLLAGLTIFSESVAAVCLAIGLFTRIAAAIIWVQMAVIIVFFQWKFGYFWTNRGYEYALLWWLLCGAIFFRGGGKYSVDRLIGKEF